MNVIKQARRTAPIWGTVMLWGVAGCKGADSEPAASTPRPVEAAAPSPTGSAPPPPASAPAAPTPASRPAPVRPADLKVQAIPTQKEMKVPSKKGEVANDPGMKRFIKQAMEDLSKREKVDLDAIKVLEARYVSWPDSSAGCPEPDMMYMQVITNGTLIRLGVKGREYRYHSDQKRPPFLCQNASAVEPIDYEFGDK